MSSVNKVILLGNLGRDPEVKYLDNGNVVARFPLATSESYRDRNGNKVEVTEWHDLEMWDELAKTAEKFLKKGRPVYIEGKLRTNKYTDKDGNPRESKRVRVTSMTLLGNLNNNNGGQGGNGGGYGKPQTQDQQQSSQQQEEGDYNSFNAEPSPSDDLPF